jgi:hypothetical protein
MYRTALLSLVGFGALAAAIHVNRELERAVHDEPAWVLLRVQNLSEDSVRLEELTITAAATNEAIHGPAERRGLPILPSPRIAPRQSDTAWIAGAFRLDRSTTVATLTVERAGAATTETHRIDIEARLGGVCSLTIAVVPDGVRGDACRDWTPTYRGAPH